MKPFLAGMFWLAAAVGGGCISASAAVIASCGDLEGYSYFYLDSKWNRGRCKQCYNDIHWNGQGGGCDHQKRIGHRKRK